ncbi:MAG: hypothetical protein KatS3mg085_659 [Candidatus Dojkabacteria bacterium]|nr:MAG: hypothetical protein KatS3mg085_659 [Candidatus Dojkabacteria bacterium]
MNEQEKEPKLIEFIDPNELISFEENTDDEENTISEESFEEVLSEYKQDEYAQKIDQTSILRKREDYRGILALVYTACTFIVFLVVIAISVIDGLNRDVSIIVNLKETIPLVSGVFLGTLGFVLGYYFKKDNE